MDTILPKVFEDWPLHERITWLKANPDNVDNGKTVFKDLNEKQIDELESSIAKQNVDLADVQKEYDDIKSAYNERLKPMKEELKTSVRMLKTGQEEITTDIYYIADYDNGRMIGYAPDGVVVENRRLRSDEMQSTIHSMNRAN